MANVSVGLSCTFTFKKAKAERIHPCKRSGVEEGCAAVVVNFFTAKENTCSDDGINVVVVARY